MIEQIFNFLKTPYVVEVLVIVWFFITLLIGLKRRFYFALYHTFIVVLFLVIGYLAIEPVLSNLFNTTLLATENGTFAEIMVNVGLHTNTPELYMSEYMINLANQHLRYLSYYIITLVVIIIAPIFSGLTWLFMRYLVPKKWLKHNPKTLGFILALITSFSLVAMVYTYAQLFAPTFTYLASNVDFINSLGLNEIVVRCLDILNPIYRPALTWIGSFADFSYIVTSNGQISNVASELSKILNEHFAFINQVNNPEVINPVA